MIIKLLDNNPETRVTFIDNPNKKIWKNWKIWKDCTKEEKEIVNLREEFINEIILDEENKNRLEEIKKKLDEEEYNYYIYETGSRGIHIHLYFNNISGFNNEQRTEMRKLLIKEFNCDPSKASEKTIIAMEERPHFKTGKLKKLIHHKQGTNVLKDSVIIRALRNINNREKQIAELKEYDFLDYFEKDPIFNYIKNNIIPDGTNRDIIIFPNLAAAAIKSGKDKKEIDRILKPIIEKNFPGKSYREFEGWYKKAITGEINYNPVQLNQWGRETIGKEFYDLTPIQVEELNEEKTKFKFYWDENLNEIKNKKTEWIIENWIPKGDICFVAGKAASFKSTICIHMGYAISMGKLVFNKYATIKSKVLYLNEENSSNILLNMVSRVKKGLDINNSSKNICFSILENIRLDKENDLKYLIKFINENNIEILICDSLRRFISFDENNATAMNSFFNNLKILRNACNNLTIVILHHLKKDNIQYTQDSRDMLRGSSDIVNSADSIIGIKRKHGCNAFQIEHIKNRSGEEMTNKLILIDVGDNKDISYFYESDKELDKTRILSVPEKCAEKIVEYLREKKIKDFSRKEIIDWIKYPYITVVRALKILENDGTLFSQGETTKRKYIFDGSE